MARNKKFLNSLKFSKLPAKNRVEVLFFEIFCVFEAKNQKSFFVKLRFLQTLNDNNLKIKGEGIDLQA
jgi:hypothetical protein